MTVAELIVELQKLDPNLEVYKAYPSSDEYSMWSEETDLDYVEVTPTRMSWGQNGWIYKEVAMMH